MLARLEVLLSQLRFPELLLLHAMYESVGAVGSLRTEMHVVAPVVDLTGVLYMGWLRMSYNLAQLPGGDLR